MKNSLGVFYTCFTETESVRHSLELLYKVYPDIPVYLVSDGGSDYSFLTEQFPDKNLKVLLEEDTRGCINSCMASRANLGPKRPDDNELLIKSVYCFLDRVNRAIDYCNCETLLIMEPDVLVRGELNIPEDVGVMGSKVNPEHHNHPVSEKLRDYIKSFPKGIDFTRWGITPAIFGSDLFKEIMNTLEEDKTIIAKICNLEPRFACYDFMFATLFAMIGVPETFNPDIVECLRNPNWKNTQKPLVHQYYGHYPRTSEGYKSSYGNRDHYIDASI